MTGLVRLHVAGPVVGQVTTPVDTAGRLAWQLTQLGAAVRVEPVTQEVS